MQIDKVQNPTDFFFKTKGINLKMSKMDGFLDKYTILSWNKKK